MTDATITRRWAALWLDYLLIGSIAGGVGLLDPHLGIFVWIALAGAYFSCFELLLGATPGKRALSLLVVGDAGQPITSRTELLRALPNVIEINPFFFGGAPAGLIANLTSQRRRLGDILASTRVIQVPADFRAATPLVASRRAAWLAMVLYLLTLGGIYLLSIHLLPFLAQRVRAGLGIPIGFRVLVSFVLFFTRYGVFLAPLFFCPFLAVAGLITDLKRGGT
jgi:uncharacterized RDD family membrane protein YckC